MCGIVGVYNFNNVSMNQETLIRMNDKMILRGPDSSGIFIKGPVALAMRRLSIIDTASGHQPIFNEAGDICVVMNGEIYNFIELRQELLIKGHVFKSQSDTEVVVHLYEEYGDDFVHHLNGMFAIGLWDQRNERLVVVRDRLGIKPLYYYHDSENFIFASSLDSIVAHPEVEGEISQESVLQFLALSYVPAPFTIYKNIFKLDAGMMQIVTRSGVKSQCYWDIAKIEIKESKMSIQDFRSEVDRLLKDSARIQARSDVPVGCFLSGGLDSSLTTALFKQTTNETFHTYSASFSDKIISDLPFAKSVAERYQTEHHTYEITPEKSLEVLDKLIPLLDEPLGDSAIVPSYLLSKCVRKHGVKVVLTGAGGDEVFGGYSYHYGRQFDDYHTFGKIYSLFDRSYWSKTLYENFNTGYQLSHHLFRLGSPVRDHLSQTACVHWGFLNHTLKAEHMKYIVNQLEKSELFYEMLEKKYGLFYGRMIFDIKNYLVENVLAVNDKTTMSASIEGRVPLLDHRLIEFIFSHSSLYSLKKGVLKHTLKEVARGYVDESIIDRPKTGFNGPQAVWVKRLLETNTFCKRPLENLLKIKIDLPSQKDIKNASCDLLRIHIVSKWLETHGYA